MTDGATSEAAYPGYARVVHSLDPSGGPWGEQD